jgi:hypothetical protein
VPHEVWQAVAPHTYGSHGVLEAAWQVPAPSQVRAGVALPALHEAAAQVVPAGHRPQAPAPLHVPVRPQVLASLAAHSLSGSVPAATGAQVPSVWPVLVCEQAMQLPAQAWSQHRPSTQLPLRQSVATEQAAPICWGGAQCPAMQLLPSAQSVLLEQLVLHEVAPQR